MRLPVAAKIALQSAGATSAGGGSPTPPPTAPPPPATRHDNALDLRRLGKTHHRIVVEVSGAVSRSRDHGAAELHRAGPALGNAAAIARAGQPDRVAQYPEQGRLGLD